MRLSLRILMIAVLPGALSAADWPQWRGPDRAGIWSDVRLPQRLSEERIERLWSVPVGGGYSGIAVVGDRVYTMERPGKKTPKERVICLSRKTGARLWAHEYEALFGDMDQGHGPRATPTVQGARVYTLGATGVVNCLEADSGEVVWSLDSEETLTAERPTWGHSASPLIVGDLLVLLIGARPNGTLTAVEKASGKERWRALGDRVGYSSPISIDVEGRRQIVVWTPDLAHGLDPRTGEVFWTVPFETSNYDVSIISPVFHDGLLFLSGYWDGARTFKINDLIDGKKPEPVWRHRKPSCLMSTPLFRDGFLYILDRSEGLLCVDWKNGETRWSDDHRLTPKERNPQASLVWAGERAVALNARGELVLAKLSPAGYEEHGRVKIIDDTWAHPAFAGQEVLARDHQRLVSVRIRPPGS